MCSSGEGAWCWGLGVAQCSFCCFSTPKRAWRSAGVCGCCFTADSLIPSSKSSDATKDFGEAEHARRLLQPAWGMDTEPSACSFCLPPAPAGEAVAAGMC